MLKPRSPPLQITPDDRHVLDLELAGHVTQHRHRNRGRIRQERSQPPHRRELQRKPEPVMVAAAPIYQLPVGVIEEEHAVKLLARQPAVTAAVRRRLGIRQELNRHPRHDKRPPRLPNRAAPVLAALFVPLFVKARVGGGDQLDHPSGAH